MKRLVIIPLTIFIFFNLLYSQNSAVNSELGDKIATQKERLKEVIYKLVKQDEYVDEVVEKITEKKYKLDEIEIQEILSKIKLVKKNLEHISVLNKNEFQSISTDPEIAKYTKAIVVYSNKIDGKIKKLLKSTSLIITGSKKQMRNAPLSSKLQSKGKSLTYLLRQNENLKTLNKELLLLTRSTSKLKATANWLYIASK